MLEIVVTEPQSPSLFALSHAVLVFAANVSKLLVPNQNSPTAMRRRAKRLREKIQIQDHDFSKIRKARNYVEHFDERMHTFMQQQGESGERAVMIYRMITDKELEDVVLEGRGPDPFRTRALQHLNTATWQLNFYGSLFALREIVNLLGFIYDSASVTRESLGASKTEA